MRRWNGRGQDSSQSPLPVVARRLIPCDEAVRDEARRQREYACSATVIGRCHSLPESPLS